MNIQNISLTDDDFEAKINDLKKRLKSRMNGKTSEQMNNTQVHYAINYGLDIKHIKELASESDYSADDCRRFWKLNIRESMLIAAMCLKDDAATADEISEWAKYVATPDMAEQSSFYLFRRVDDVDKFVSNVISQGGDYSRCIAYFTTARVLQSHKSVKQSTLDALLGMIEDCNTPSMADVRGMSFLLRQLVACGLCIERVGNLVDGFSKREELPLKQLAYEVRCEMDMQ